MCHIQSDLQLQSPYTYLESAIHHTIILLMKYACHIAYICPTTHLLQTTNKSFITAHISQKNQPATVMLLSLKGDYITGSFKLCHLFCVLSMIILFSYLCTIVPL